MAAVLVVRDVRKEFPTDAQAVRALDGVSLTVDEGEFVCIMGASGSGKSTLLHLVGGLDRPTSGSITIEGRDITRMSDRERTLFRRRRMGVIFQAFNLLPTLTAVENVALPSIIDGSDGREVTKRARSLLEELDLGHRGTHRPQAMSGGEQQRVAIARALMNDPAIVLADEPTGNLDTRHGEEVWRALATMSRARGKTVIAVTHESAGATFADRVVVIKDGRIAGQIEPGGEGHAALVATRYAELVG
ncbi:MAG: ABC transporter ATP-binding protein [Phycisphaerales bacterium]|nr:MAG: ABC transporter ATP-binding protein [Phycisphaerales bacterium]